ncbi:hypothetical protein BUALT_Bualt09G0043600 [Buddleja alternifolia]|uniref:FLZ-type domain-containing protein n=1 Tax=Buddleja alternifolia TaxID=168488 RepID=A0AAV6X0I4_9LAMI|nr:hypothetical protein BUALT_Bualt09G0043600 [Buddleja alternifolia]
MLGKNSKPVIEILTGSLVSGHISGILDFAMSPRSHMESKAQSPKGLKSFDFGGVGLGIVAALENSGGDQNEVPANKALLSRNLSQSNPIPVNSCNSSRKKRVSEETTKIESLEDYTIVTCHGPNESYTKVYWGGGREGDDRTPFRIQNNRASVFHISPARFVEVTGIPPSDFLSSCDLCQKKLHGKDIYMYRGEKAFCSTECRYKQIVMDERTEKCSSEASTPVDVSGSPYANEQILTTGILAS